MPDPESLEELYLTWKLHQTWKSYSRPGRNIPDLEELCQTWKSYAGPERVTPGLEAFCRPWIYHLAE